MRSPLAPALVLALLLGGCGDDDDATAESSATPPDPARQERAGEALYRRYCSLCHGRDAEGYAADDAPSLRSPEWLRSASDEYITSAIENGRPGTPMSAWSHEQGGPLHDPEIAAILAYLRSLQRHPRANVDEVVIQGDPARGRVVYTVHCARCHGLRGEGRDAVALANPQLLEDASDGFLQYAVLHGRTGTRMEGFAERLEPQQIDDVVAYVRSFEDGAPELPQQGDQPELPSLDEMPLVIHPGGETPDFTLREERFVPAADVAAALERGERIVILDARATSDWLRGRIPGAIPVPFYELDEITAGLPRDGTWMVAYCGCPHAASGRVVDALRRAGFEHTAVLDEGIHFWEEQGFPMSSGEELP